MASNVKITDTFVGADKIERKLKQEIADSVEFIAENIILGDAVRRAPIDTSALRQSGRVTIDKNRFTDKTTAIIGFYTAYAATQHEGNFNHPQGGERYYLSNALKANTPMIKKIIAANIKKVKKF
jgi:hypothetical protein